ncbi:hypothetical protein KJ365_00835 [Glaciecola sp. XM2]|uniref:hypothetical protein n=1 Tax=Glaciecola sp. XM2 TaxID=1914931 RepID=UPI001BDE7606|nr:hypothetical protein [Glaciecola sp. XM2]MBT1449412.1 hypothetical protein [Glaciecola sp. XM2]
MQMSLEFGYWVGGSLIILLAAFSFFTQMSLMDILGYVEQLFGLTFTLLFSSLVMLSAWAILKIYQDKQVEVWTEVGLQAANGISTLALTFTLLGISLGIGSLSNQTLTPESVQGIISQLTSQFSMAFMTTVIGLPTATFFRAWIGILSVKRQNNEQTS